jgi:hypothetical protein
MEPLVRKQLYLTRRQARWIAERARAEQRSEAELVRELLDRALDAAPTDPTAMEKFLQTVDRMVAEKPAESRPPGSGRGWTREELYEEREARWHK